MTVPCAAIAVRAALGLLADSADVDLEASLSAVVMGVGGTAATPAGTVTLGPVVPGAGEAPQAASTSVISNVPKTKSGPMSLAVTGTENREYTDR